MSTSVSLALPMRRYKAPADVSAAFLGGQRWRNWFSNMALVPGGIHFGGEVYPAVENAFHAAKSDFPPRRRALTRMKPGEAKTSSRGLPCRDGWDDMKLAAMDDLLRQRALKDVAFADGLLRHQEELVEWIDWSGDYWGARLAKSGSGVIATGRNALGLLLSALSEDLRADIVPTPVGERNWPTRSEELRNRLAAMFPPSIYHSSSPNVPSIAPGF